MTAPFQMRELAARTRGHVESSLDIESGLSALHVTARRRRRTEWIAAAAAVLAVLGVTAGLVSRQHAAVGPADPPTSATDGPVDTCGVVPVSICPDRSVVVDAGAFTWSTVLPARFSTDTDIEDAPDTVEFLQRGSSAAVSVLLGVEPAEPSDSVEGAMELASWVSARPFLAASAPEEIDISGYPAWRVDVRLEPGTKAGESQEDSCNGSQPECHPVLRSAPAPEHREVGIWPNMSGSFTFVDAPDGRVMAIWSWSFKGPGALGANDALISEITLEER
jgi:hypothetical protein